ncbi:MAG: NYN domain-containing protein [bacterium]
MKLFEKISRLFLSDARGSDAENESVVVVDVESLISPPNHGRQSSTQEKLSMLNRLAAFVEREKVPLTALFCGTPLRTAPEGESFRGVTVCYASRKDEAPVVVLRILSKRGRGRHSVVVTADAKVERAAVGSGSKVMHAATFRKALETATDSQRPKQPPKQPPRQNPPPQPAPKQETDINKQIVNELIDPL